MHVSCQDCMQHLYMRQLAWHSLSLHRSICINKQLLTHTQLARILLFVASICQLQLQTLLSMHLSEAHDKQHRMLQIIQPSLQSGLSACASLQVLVAGSETTAEHRVQLYTPAYLQNGKPRPSITSVSSSSVTYGQNLTVGFSNVTSIDRVVLNKYTGATHGNHFDQRQVMLEFGVASSNVVCTLPPNGAVAPPGQYMLFVLYDGVPSVAQIVSLQLQASSASANTAAAG